MLPGVPDDLQICKIGASEHLAFVQEQPSASFLQTPAWGTVKDGWKAESIGWRRQDVLIGTALVLYRRVPALGRYLAYIPEGPLIDWSSPDLSAWLDPMQDYVRAQGAFAVRMGPPVVSRVWAANTVKEALANESHPRLGGVPPDESMATGLRVEEALSSAGWQPRPAGSGFPAGQPRYVVQVQLTGHSEESLLAGMNNQWRRNIKKALAADIEIRAGSAADLPAFHRIYLETARRNRFKPRSAKYFETMYRALAAESKERIRLHLAHHQGRLIAGAIRIRVGSHAWYAYGGSTLKSRDVRGSNAVQWHLMREALHEGVEIYDLRGVRDNLDPACPSSGLLRFKVGTGGRVIGYAGEWTLPFSRPLHAAFDLFMRHRFRGRSTA